MQFRTTFRCPRHHHFISSLRLTDPVQNEVMSGRCLSRNKSCSKVRANLMCHAVHQLLMHIFSQIISMVIILPCILSIHLRTLKGKANIDRSLYKVYSESLYAVNVPLVFLHFLDVISCIHFTLKPLLHLCLIKRQSQTSVHFLTQCLNANG